MDDKKVSFYEKTSKQPKEPNEKINFSSIVDVDDNIDKAHVALENVPDTEKRCLFRVCIIFYSIYFRLFETVF